ncbi:helix-turn-helix transcriptional regulator [Paenibacillus sp. UMB7766-LJ446]|uniref:helix-turn-helix domain-containing protein n=1 Tax=Paenibacillus sp. UMB7766-LJ446 TaxID=3046313 RepID=UPI00254A7B13|nr:helix-turn-helix transcriptional regulator [Paenibacillus sp. UMB7766-LJ446]MDK8188829.1 helix-turn-helix transcriptional regulator [Paenibacillus sp. UMB7766-LJ446]
MNISTQMKPVINERGLNPSELAHIVGCSPQYIHNLLNGNRRWNEETLSKVCGALDLEIKLLPKVR